MQYNNVLHATPTAVPFYENCLAWVSWFLQQGVLRARENSR